MKAMSSTRPKKGKSADDLCKNAGCDYAEQPPVMEDDEEEEHLNLMEAKSNFGLPTEALIPKIPASGILSLEKEEPPPPIPILNHKNMNANNNEQRKKEDEVISGNGLISA